MQAPQGNALILGTSTVSREQGGLPRVWARPIARGHIPPVSGQFLFGFPRICIVAEEITGCIGFDRLGNGPGSGSLRGRNVQNPEIGKTSLHPLWLSDDPFNHPGFRQLIFPSFIRGPKIEKFFCEILDHTT